MGSALSKLLAVSERYPELKATQNFLTLQSQIEVDQANVISPAIKDQITEILTNIENTTTDQIVILMLPTLDGHSIEDYGYKLARHWGIGQKDKDNGAIIIVDVNERSIRIEVGYGLEDSCCVFIEVFEIIGIFPKLDFISTCTFVGSLDLRMIG
ncbi:uncharacterized protein TRIADDRAFT_63025 [Trichoplax adhaerens]|uniref:TPM domain-containing protein n=1 Tax=Trichoplax adhaerens TaxID=10228 RepID=B3SFP0_TRIAD|nr:hypothetical protein TRIADDRAFT_63025 [Trichoplax adhaerens]EDV18455.1 hypothetical protein TRIADDRAFT_63025 [Trichoplax adhaerens]|eukprot:XP_002119059.1 hypothetical protein TRIADDRAFT_63025 [Trichoplax adhaerens]